MYIHGWARMKSLVVLLVAVLLVSGCASQRPSPAVAQISQKRDEAEVLRQELDMAARQLIRAQHDLAGRVDYSARTQERDLDSLILILRQARARLASETKRLHEQYGVSYGPY